MAKKKLAPIDDEPLVTPPPLDSTKMEKEDQVKLTEKLQALWLRRMVYLLEYNLMAATDMATLYRFLSDNGWNVDPARIPKGLKDKLTKHLDPTAFTEEDGVIGKIA